MALVATITSVDVTQNHFIVKGKIAVSGSYPGSPDTLSLLNMGGAVPMPPTTQLPDWVEITELPPSGSTYSGLTYQYILGTTQANGKVEVLVSGASGAVMSQLGNVTYASVSAANLVFKAEFPKFK